MAYAFGYLGCTLGVQAWQYQGELFAAKAPEQVVAAQMLADTRDQMAKHGIACLMAKLIVDALEVVSIDHYQGCWLFALSHYLQQRLCLFLQASAVQRVGQAVAFGQSMQRLGRPVMGHQNEPAGHAYLRQHRAQQGQVL